MTGGVLLPRWISRCGAASRRTAEQAVFEGRVTVDGQVCRDVLRQVFPGRSRVALDGRPVAPVAPVWLALNKARGVVTTTSDPEGRPTVLDGIPDPAPGLAPVGRLDRDSGGLLLLTNDHLVAASLLDPTTHVEKVYRVKVKGHPDAQVLTRLASVAVQDRGESLGPIQVKVTATGPASTWLEVRLTEGKNRQIRRQLDAVGFPVEVLIRVAFGGIGLGALAPGEWRVLEPNEIAALRRAGGS